MRKILVFAVSFLVGISMISGCGGKDEGKETTQAESKGSSNSQNNSASDSANEEEKKSLQVFAMDTYMNLTAYGEQAEEGLQEAKKRIEELDEKLSIGNKSSEIYQINKNGKGKVSEDTSYLIERSLDIWKDTEGAFNPVMEPVMETWGFTSGNYKVPTKQELKKCLALTDATGVQLDSNKENVTLTQKDMKLDLGGIAKGYTSSEIMKIFKQLNMKSAMVSLGGNAQVLGSKTDGSPWKIAIQDPEEEEQYLGILQVKNKAVITSGGYERYFEKDGKTYHHIIDPSTGYPAESGLLSVSIVSEDGTLADGLSTALFVMGKEKAEKYWKKNSKYFDAVFFTTDHKLYVTEGIAKDFSSEKEFEVIKK